MKTFTTYAAKAKQFLNLLQGYTKGIRLTAILILLLMGVSNVWGYTISSAKIYYDDSNSKWGSNVVVAFDKNDGGAVFAMTKIDNTSLYYWTGTWGDGGVSYMRFGQTTKTYDWYGWWTNVNSTWDLSQTDKWTGVSNGWGTDIKNASKMFGAESNSSGANLTKTDLDSYASLNSQQTIKSAVDGADANSKATISITSYAMTGNGTATEQTATLGTGAKDSYVDAARTATTTLTVGDVATGYQFDGWYAAKTGGTAISTSTTYTYYPTAATIVYARFSTKQHTVKFGVHSSGHGSLTAKVGSTSISSDNKVNYGSTIVFTATPSTGYQIEGWYSNSACTTPINNGTNDTYTVTITGGTNVYVKFKATEYTITYKDQGGSNFSGTHADRHPTTHTYGTETTLKDPTRLGFIFGGWFTSSDCTGTAVTSLGATAYTADITLYAQWTAITITATLTPTEGTIGANNLTFSITSNVPTNSGYWVGVYNFGEDDYAGGVLSGITSYNNNPQTHTGTRNFVKAGTYYTRAFIMLNSETLAKSDKIAFVVRDGGTTPDPEDLTWKMYDKTTELGTFTKQDENTYTLTIDVPENCNWLINYKYDQQYYTGAEPLSQERTLVVGDAQVSWHDGAGTFTITIRKDSETWKISAIKQSPITVTATEGGTVSPSGTVQVGERTPTTFTATPAPGYRFDEWTYTGGIRTSGSLTNSSIDITANGTGTLTAHFVRVHTVNFFATPAVAGSVAATVGGNTIKSGDKLDDKTSVTFTADVANAYDGQCTFVKWVDGAGTQLSNASRYQHTVTEDITVKAIFKIKQYTLTFSAGEGGHVSAIANNSAIASPANLDYNTSVTLTAKPDAGCAFEGWYEGKTKKSSEISYTINLTADKTIEAQFTKGTTVYMKAIEYWKKDHPRYAIYYWGAGDKNGWVDMTNVDCNGDIYEGYVPAGYTNFMFVRLAPSTSNSFDPGVAWNQTANLTTIDNAGKMYIQPHVYLKPNSDWKSNGARFAAYFYADGKEAKWFSMNDLDGDGIYSCEIPTGYTSVIFCRMNPNFDTNDWDRDGNDYVWNQTGDLNINTNTSLFTITGWGTGSWSAGPHKNGWQTYAEPSYKITYSQPTNGTITVTTKAGAAIKNGDELTMGDEIKITFTPADGYELINYNVEYATETGEEGVYSVCGPTNITTVEFAKAGTARTVYLRPNEDWMKDEPIFAAYAWNNKNTTQNHWYIMTTKADDYTGAYSCNISSTYDMVTFVRIKPKGRDNSDGTLDFQNAWNQTIDLQIMNNIPRFAIGEERTVGDKQKYDGAWEKNTPIWGLATNFNDWKAEKAVFKGYPGKLDVAPPFGTSHEFKLYNFFGIEASNNLWHGNSGTMKRANSGQWWTMEGTEGANCKMMLDVSGEYIYQMRFLTIGTDLKKQVSVTYPEADMYYVMYEETTSEGTKQRISYGIGITGEERLDTVSFFVDIAKSAKIYILNSNREKVGDYYTIIGTGGENQGGAMAPKRRAAAEEDPTLRVEQGCGIEESGVYNFVAQQDADRNVTLLIDKWHAYTGAYYIRTDAASGGWGSYKQNGNKMTYTSYADKNHNFDHYYCKWITSSESSYANVKFCVANDYSHQLSDELDGDEIIEKALVPTGCLPDKANVRFGWDSKTNELSRAYISGSSDTADRFLVLTGNDYLLDINGNKLKVDGLYDNEAIFGDQGNWVYQLDVQANTQTAIKLTAEFNDRVQTFFGDARAAADGEEVMAATTPEYHKVRMIYNFKTNHLLAAWLLDHPNQDINNGEVNANVLIIRENHGDANQLQFNNNLTEMTVNTAYAVMTFTEKHVTNNSLTNFARYEYWVSFPFDVKISDVFGFGEYGDTWIMQLYDGAGRAEKGYWADSPTFWKYITNKNYTLKAGVGYVLKLDKGQMATKKKGAWTHTDAVSLYFPSTPNDAGNTIISATPDTQHEIPSHECTIQREKRYIYDSHWNLIGVPGYANIKDFNTAATLSPVKYEAGQVSFYYEYLSADNSYQATSAKSDFKNMHSYMVQFAGTINWSTPDTPTKLAARRNSDYAEPEKVSFRLELAQGEEKADQTFVQLQQEGATPDFDMNLDLTKIINSGANIYTLAGESRIQSAGNALPMGEAVVVPVGVKVDAEGEYTFRMPDGTEGMVVELVDYETNNRTNLLLSDYIVTLPKGTSENRFALHIQPQKDVVTSLENIGEGVNNGEAVNKYLIDGKLIIRTAEGIFDAQGHRL